LEKEEMEIQPGPFMRSYSGRFVIDWPTCNQQSTYATYS